MTPFLSRDGMHLWRTDARRLSEIIEPESVDLLVTSPPYWEQRAYTDGGVRYEGQIGLEPTWREYLDNLIECTADWAKVLKRTGSMFVNLGDKMVDKHQLSLPERYVVRCADDLGLVKRAAIIWEKPNGLPESVTDRVRNSHEYIFHLTRQGRYYAAVDEVREASQERPGLTWEERKAAGHPMRYGEQAGATTGTAGFTTNPLGKLPGSVWSIPSEPLQVPKYRILVNGEPIAFTPPGATDDSLAERDALLRRHAHRNPTWDALPDHFAAFPTEIPRRCILGWSPNGICVECGEGRRPVVAKELVAHRHNLRADHKHSTGEGIGPDYALLQYPVAHQEATITGYACACPTPDAPTRPAVILDPFGGTGTTALVARALGRHAHHVDLSHDYLRLAEWRIWHDTNAFRKASERSGIKVPEPPKIDGQLSMLDALG